MEELIRTMLHGIRKWWRINHLDPICEVDTVLPFLAGYCMPLSYFGLLEGEDGDVQTYLNNKGNVTISIDYICVIVNALMSGTKGQSVHPSSPVYDMLKKMWQVRTSTSVSNQIILEPLGELAAKMSHEDMEHVTMTPPKDWIQSYATAYKYSICTGFELPRLYMHIPLRLPDALGVSFWAEFFVTDNNVMLVRVHTDEGEDSPSRIIDIGQAVTNRFNLPNDIDDMGVGELYQYVYENMPEYRSAIDDLATANGLNSAQELIYFLYMLDGETPQNHPNKH